MLRLAVFYMFHIVNKSHENTKTSNKLILTTSVFFLQEYNIFCFQTYQHLEPANSGEPWDPSSIFNKKVLGPVPNCMYFTFTFFTLIIDSVLWCWSTKIRDTLYALCGKSNLWNVICRQQRRVSLRHLCPTWGKVIQIRRSSRHCLKRSPPSRQDGEQVKVLLLLFFSRAAADPGAKTVK